MVEGPRQQRARIGPGIDRPRQQVTQVIGPRTKERGASQYRFVPPGVDLEQPLRTRFDLGASLIAAAPAVPRAPAVGCPERAKLLIELARPEGLLAGGRPLVPSGPPSPKRDGVQPVAQSRAGLSNPLV